MNYAQLMETVASLTAGAETAAALVARMELDESESPADQELRAALDHVVEAAGAADVLSSLDVGQRQMLLGRVIVSLKAAVELIENPGRPSGWFYSDPVVLRAQGGTSAPIPRSISEVGLPGLDEALARDGARILDIGSGVAAFSIACCRLWPNVTVVGIDPWEPANEIARENIAVAGLEGRITLRPTRVEEMDDEEAFELVWMPTLFPTRAVVEASLPRIARSLRHGGWLVIGRQATVGDPLRQALSHLGMTRRGGSALSDDDALSLLTQAGLGGVRITRTDRPGVAGYAVGQRLA